MTQPDEPTTAAGRALLSQFHYREGKYLCLPMMEAEFTDRILAIEREAIADFLAAPETARRLGVQIAHQFNHAMESSTQPGPNTARIATDILAALRRERE